jgi:hypothetical protein
MKETPSAFERRTSGRYDPPAGLRALGARLRSREDCPSLFRFPGPEGLRKFLRGEACSLGPGLRAWTWYHERPGGAGTAGPTLFGTVAVLDPLRLQPCRAEEPGAWIGLSRLPEDPEATLWLPPSQLAAPLPWDDARRASEIRERIGPAYEEELGRVGAELDAYLEELSALARAGAKGPAVPWCDVPVEERIRRLHDSGVKPVWTRATNLSGSDHDKY